MTGRITGDKILCSMLCRTEKNWFRGRQDSRASARMEYGKTCCTAPKITGKHARPGQAVAGETGGKGEARGLHTGSQHVIIVLHQCHKGEGPGGGSSATMSQGQS